MTATQLALLCLGFAPRPPVVRHTPEPKPGFTPKQGEMHARYNFVVDLLKTHGPMDVVSIQEHVDCKRGALLKTLMALRSSGRVRATKQKGVWFYENV
jgi:hypothetical protein